MHEAGLCMELVRSLEEEGARQGFRKVLAVWVEIGQRRAVEPEAMRFAFDLATRGTLAEGARLSLELRPARGWCFACSQEVALADPLVLCAQCGSAQTRVTGGEELTVRQIEVE